MQISTLSIADITWAIRCNRKISLHESSPEYLPFFQSSSSEREQIERSVTLELDHFPDLGSLPVIFDARNWCLLRDGKTRYITRNAASSAWIAAFDETFTDSTVFCNESMVTMTDDNVVVENPMHYPLDQIILSNILARNRGILLHCAGLEIHGKGCVFPGKSGAGKSTLSRQFLVGDTDGAVRLLSDDRVVVRDVADGRHAYGTPWPGDAGVSKNERAQLHGLFFITQGTDNRVVELSRNEALNRLLPIASIPWYDLDGLSQVLRYCETLVSDVPTFEFSFTPDQRAVDLMGKIAETL